MTIGELKSALSRYPDDTAVFIGDRFPALEDYAVPEGVLEIKGYFDPTYDGVYIYPQSCSA